MVVIFLTVFFNVDMIPGKREINNAMFQWIKYSLIDITACDFEYSFKVTNKNIRMNVAVIQRILIVFFSCWQEGSFTHSMLITPLN